MCKYPTLFFLFFLFQILQAQPTQQGGYTHQWANYSNSETNGLGLVNLTFDLTGVTDIRQVAPIGEHPRIYFSNADTALIFSRLRSNNFGKAVYKQLHAHTILLHKGYSNGGIYNQNADYAKDASNNRLISNAGYWDVKLIYSQLSENNPDVWTNFTDPDRMKVASVMSMEAFDCLMNKGKTDTELNLDYDLRAQNLAKAMHFWAKTVLNTPTITANTNIKFGGLNMSMCYDLNHWAMNDAQRDTVRLALAQIISPTPRYGKDLNCMATTSNWAALNSFELLTNLAIEGEIGYSDSLTYHWARTYHNFLTYGYLPSGEGYEGTGKNYLFATTMIPLAMRGYGLLGHPHVRAYATRYLNALAQPFGYGFVGSDVWGGHGIDPVRGGYHFNASDAIGLKYIFPDDPAVDFLWKTYISKSTTLTTTGYVTQLLNGTDGYYNYILMGAMLGLDYGNSTVEEANDGQLDYFSKEGGQGVMRSDFSEEAMSVLFHARQNNGGHTYGNRNEFTISALGRTWVQRIYGGSPFQATNYHNCILIDGQGIVITDKDGDKARQPAKITGWISEPKLSAITGDATYAYNWEWNWQAQPLGSNNTNLNINGWTEVTEMPNDFQLTPLNEMFVPNCNTSYYNQPSWNNANKYERMVKKRYKTIEKVKRTAALVKTMQPFLLIVDDVKQDSLTHLYRWQANIPSDLTLETTYVNLINSDFKCDAILKEATGNRRLLVRVLQNEGYTAALPPAFIENLIYADYWGNTFTPNPNIPRQRLVIESNSIEPKFKVLLFPFVEGDALPTTKFNALRDTLEVTIGNEIRTLAFKETLVDGHFSLVHLVTLPPFINTFNPLIDNELKIYPSVTNDFINVNYSGSERDFKIINQNGQVVFKGNIKNKIDVSTLVAGIYWLKIGDEKVSFLRG
jgi:hypothetical protein